MAKSSMLQRELKRKKLVERLQTKRAALKETARQAYIAGEDAYETLDKLQKLSRNSSKTRQQRRCNSCGRPHGVYRKFGLCRLCLRKFAMQGFVPGLEKASW